MEEYLDKTPRERTIMVLEKIFGYEVTNAHMDHIYVRAKLHSKSTGTVWNNFADSWQGTAQIIDLMIEGHGDYDIRGSIDGCWRAAFEFGDINCPKQQAYNPEDGHGFHSGAWGYDEDDRDTADVTIHEAVAIAALRAMEHKESR